MAIIQSNGLVEVDSIPTWTPTGTQARFARLTGTNTFYYYNGSWNTVVLTTVAANDGLEVTGGNLKLGDNAEGSTEPGVLTSDRIINHDGNAIIHAAIERVVDNGTGVAVIKKILNPQVGTTTVWAESVGSFDNAGSTTNNFVFYEGFNITAAGTLIDATKHGWGIGWEFHYEPGTGDIFVERHTVLVEVGGTNHRISSHTIEIADKAQWEEYNTLAKWYIKDPTNGGTYAAFQRGNTANSQLYLQGSATGNGVRLEANASTTDFVIAPSGYASGARFFYMNGWEAVALPAINSNNIGAKWNVLNGDIELPNIPTYADEAAAVTAGLAQHRVYKTSTGELRIKL